MNPRLQDLGFGSLSDISQIWRMLIFNNKGFQSLIALALVNANCQVCVGGHRLEISWSDEQIFYQS